MAVSVRAGVLVLGSLLTSTRAQSSVEVPSFASDVAPLVYRACTPCHRSGQPAPFALSSYADVFKKRAQIAEVTERRFMPPWLPTHGEFVGDRRLSAAEIELLRRWIDAGAPRGDAAKEPPPPVFTGEWQLGTPDLIVRTAVPITVPASGPDVVRNFVILVPSERLHFVEAVEIRPGNAAVHHAVLAVDSSRESRRLDALDAEPGFPGMVPGAAGPPDGHFLGWTPGKSVRREEPGSAWRLRPGDDLVLQLHLVPTGKPEIVQPEIGFWYTERATTVQYVPIMLFSEAIDIAPGVSDFVVQDHLVLPVDVMLHAIYPHAHYLCRTMRATARLPNGKEQVLIAIDAWDFDWQDDYRFFEPVRLPAGSRVAFEYVYDNSEDNPHNPSRPPGRVRFGQSSRDEMGTLTISVTLADAEVRRRLDMAVVDRQLEKLPKAWSVWLQKARLERECSQLAAADAAVATARRLAPEQAAVSVELGFLAETRGLLDVAVGHYEAALQRDSGFGIAHLQLGGITARRGRTDLAIGHFTLALQALPNSAIANNNFANACFELGRLVEAELHYRRALALEPDYFGPQFNLGRVLAAVGRKDEARAALERAALLRPGDAAVAAALRDLDH